MIKISRKRFVLFFSPTTIVSVVLLLTIPFAWLLPASWGQENGPVENVQVVMIMLTGVIAYSAYRWGAGAEATKRLYLWTIPIIFIVGFRELSWGRVFYPNGHGWYLPLKALWYGKYVYPSIGLIIAIVLCGIYLQRLDKEILQWVKYGKFPIIDIIMIFGGYFAADFVEHHTHGSFAAYQDLFEELFELLMYCGVFSLFTNLGFNKLFQPDHVSMEKKADTKMPYL